MGLSKEACQLFSEKLLESYYEKHKDVYKKALIEITLNPEAKISVRWDEEKQDIVIEVVYD